MTAKIDLTGHRFGRLVVAAEASNTAAGKARWFCACDCGGSRVVAASSLRGSVTRSCGCLQRETASHRLQRDGEAQRAKARHAITTHGCASHGNTTKAYRAWTHILGRCHNETDRAYPNYGGRGIVVCDRWRSSFTAFLADMGEPSADLSLDRIDNDGPYSPDNCRWATCTEQARNQRTNRVLTVGEKSLTLAEWAELTGIPSPCIWKRLNRGWDIEKALSQPPTRANLTVAIRAGA